MMSVLVVGLGRFGSALANELVGMGHEVLGVDSDDKVANEHRDALTSVLVGDATDPEFLRQIDASSFERAVVAIGSHLEASILTTSNLVDVGVTSIWAKALTTPHGRILSRVGAHHVVFPEREMGERVAHLVAGSMLDFLELDDAYAVVETIVPPSLVGQALATCRARERFDVSVVAVRSGRGTFAHPDPGHVFARGDVLVVGGPQEAVEAFSRDGRK
jgi:trk system potassium uptake protein TrkA